MKIEHLKIDEILPYTNNPRKIPQNAVDAVAASIERFGFRFPIGIDANNIIVAGHTRLQAAKKLGMTKIPCTRIDDLSKEDIDLLRVLDNKSHELSAWDFDKLTLELKVHDLSQEVINLHFSHMELDALIGDNDDEEESPVKMKKKGGKSVRFTKEEYLDLSKSLDAFRADRDPEMGDASAVLGICDQWLTEQYRRAQEEQ